MSPLLTSVEERGIQGMRLKRNPLSIKPVDFFTGAVGVRQKFARMVHCDPVQVALMPSVSYGMNSVIRNIPYAKGQHALTLSEEFPSCYYTAQRWCKDHGAELRVVARRDDLPDRGRDWNDRILEAISRDTAFVVMASVHWMNGTKFNLEDIGARCREVGAKLIVDGSQSVGALPIDVRKANIDALICAAYKWLMGPYSTALSFIHEDFNKGIPLEESWMTRPNAERFDRLTNYVKDYKPGAVRFDVGQSSNFIFLPMLDEALGQLLDWGIDEIQHYSRVLGAPLIDFFMARGTPVADEEHRAHHLMGLQLPPGTNGEELLDELKARNVFVSLRGDNLRISLSVFNNEEDVGELIAAIK
ncbi:MAG: aminotransferase class V-fold PLP-dependent enzyme [Bacteroidales bacterium]|nr:aminotransferase class V-fold PLP-dependent enzyme [Bacteroidales bacterium]